MTEPIDNSELPKHKIYEMVTADILKKLDPHAKVEHNVNVQVVGGTRTRQIDVYIQGQIIGMPLNIIVDCKYYKSKLDVKDIDEFIGMVDDLKPNMGILISSTGFTPGAIDRSKKEGNRINLCSIFNGDKLDYSTPILSSLIKAERIGDKMRIRFSNGTGENVNLNLPENKSLFEVEDNNGNRIKIFDLAWQTIESTPSWTFKESGVVGIDTNNYQLVNGSSLLKLGFLEIDVQTKIKCFKRELPFENGMAILNENRKIISSTDLTTNWTRIDDGWEEISLEDAILLNDKLEKTNNQ